MSDDILVGVVASDTLKAKQVFRLTMQQKKEWYEFVPSFQSQMNDVVNKMAGTRLAMPLMPNPTLADQTTATIQIRVVGTGVGHTVAELVNALNGLVEFAEVRTLEYQAGRIGLKPDDPKDNADIQKQATTDKKKEDAAASPLTTIADAGKKVLTTVEMVAVVALVIVVLIGLHKGKQAL